MTDAAAAPAADKEDVVLPVIVGDTREPIYEVGICKDGHLHVEFPHTVTDPGRKLFTELQFQKPEDVYDFAQTLLRGYDQMVGI